jgi:23S rRNA G2069 N7-methylase RlmK/C1962 C5-methylase RlmI
MKKIIMSLGLLMAVQGTFVSCAQMQKEAEEELDLQIDAYKELIQNSTDLEELDIYKEMIDMRLLALSHADELASAGVMQEQSPGDTERAKELREKAEKAFKNLKMIVDKKIAMNNKTGKRLMSQIPMGEQTREMRRESLKQLEAASEKLKMAVEKRKERSGK